MFKNWLEYYQPILMTHTRDGFGGSVTSETVGEPFLCGMVEKGADSIAVGEGVASKDKAVLMHERSVMLRPGDIVERIRDGVRLRVTGGRREAPAVGGLNIAETDAERLVIAG